MNVEAARINPGLALAVIGALALPVGLIAGLVVAPRPSGRSSFALRRWPELPTLAVGEDARWREPSRPSCRRRETTGGDCYRTPSWSCLC